MNHNGKSFGITREKYQKVFLKTGSVINKWVTAPNTYKPYPEFGKNGLKAGMRPRTTYEENKTARIVPGPGNSVPLSFITAKGNFFVSNYRDSGATKFVPCIRFTSYVSLSPGPATYAMPGTLHENASVN